MAILKEVKASKIYMGKLAHGGDLLEEITSCCRENGITLGRIEGLGAVQKVRLAYYNQESKKYQFHELNRPLEITNMVGNISLKEGRPMVHAHLTLADENGTAFGGHLAAGTVIFACEVCIHSLEGPAFSRGHDGVTGLPLWIINNE